MNRHPKSPTLLIKNILKIKIDSYLFFLKNQTSSNFMKSKFVLFVSICYNYNL
jgi:hypothetical protein